MRISLGEIKKLVPAAAKIATDDLVKLIGARLVEVEEKIDLSEKYQGIYVVKVVECEAIPDTHLHLCQIDNGQEKIQVVCGAPNVRKDMNAVWIAPGSIVPQTFGGENFRLDVRKLRGYESNGMLAGLDELDLGDDHSGIVETDPAIAAGTPFADAFDLNDIILDIENKSLTHRPDCFGLIGFAREIAGILGEPFDYQLSTAPAEVLTAVKDATDLSIEISDYSICPAYNATVFDFSALPAPEKYLSKNAVFLAKCGARSISPIVDITNIVMFLTGQPLHAFDYDKFVQVGSGSDPKAGDSSLKASSSLKDSSGPKASGPTSAKIGVRPAKNGEKLVLLDDKEIELNSNDIVITSNDVPVALAGAMGGKNTEIDASTKRIIVEVASFSLFNLRRTQMSYGIFSEAITRFTKGRPASDLLPATLLAVSDFENLGAKLSGYATASDPALYEHDDYKQNIVYITVEEINSLLGTSYDKELIIRTLKNVGFVVESCESVPLGESPESIRIIAPSWRTDIHIKEDVIEEVGRLLGYDNIPLEFPTRPFIGAEKNALLSLKTKIREILSGRLAANELLTYSFVSRKLQESVGENPDDSYKIVNSISPELQCFRQSLVPSLLEKVRDNLKSGYQDFSVYELNQVTKKSYGKDADNVPILKNHLAFVTIGDFYQAKAALLALLNDLGLPASALPAFAPLSAQPDITSSPVPAPATQASTAAVSPIQPVIISAFEPLHSASLDLSTAGSVAIGEIKSTVLRRFKISVPVSAFELDLDALLAAIPSTSVSHLSISRFPSVERDITLKVAEGTAFSTVIDPILSVFKAKNLNIELDPLSIYQKSSSTGTSGPSDKSASSDKSDSSDESSSTDKNLSFHLRFSSNEKTLESAEISAIMDEVTKNVKTVGAEIV